MSGKDKSILDKADEASSDEEQGSNCSTNSQHDQISKQSRNARRRQKQRQRQKQTAMDHSSVVSSREPVPTFCVNRDIVFKYILNSFKGSCTIQDLADARLFPGDVSINDLSSWLTNAKTFKLIPVSEAANQTVVRIHDSKMRLCYKYPEDCPYFTLCMGYVMGSCSRRTNPACSLAHSFKFDPHNCDLLDKPEFAHLAAFTDDQLRCILRNSSLHVCVAYNQAMCPNSGCRDGYTCPDLHICAKYVTENCSNSGSCHLTHSLKRRDNKLLLSIYHMTAIKDAIVLKMLIVPTEVESRKPEPAFVPIKPQKSKLLELDNKGLENGNSTSSDKSVLKMMTAEDKCTKPQTVSIPMKPKKSKIKQSMLDKKEPGGGSSKFRNISPKEENPPSPSSLDLNHKTQWLCEPSLRNMCKSASGKCTNIHYELPYLWVAKQGADKWQPIRNSEEKERQFCIVNNQQFQTATLITTEESNSVGYKEPVIHLVNLLRISTPTYWQDGRIDDNSFHTVWIWYWEDNGLNVWVQYEANDIGPYQDVIESSFHKYQRQVQNLLPESSSDCDLRYFYFENDKFPYRIDFENMVQENLLTGKERQIRRRPRFVSKEDVKSGKAPQKPKVHYHPGSANFKASPWSWVPMDTKTKPGLQKILLQHNEEHNRISDTFFSTMDPHEYKIIEIMRLQNLTLWKNYDRKRKEMMRSDISQLTGIDERQLFHGTPDEMSMKCITNQGFDPRMSGKHATKFGYGAYFARDAKYSNNYTDRTGGIQYMFLARVLVGKPCKGDSQTKRPPPLNPARPEGDLYDSCVDDVGNPSIYVLFDRDQCYPELLIKYREIVSEVSLYDELDPMNQMYNLLQLSSDSGGVKVPPTSRVQNIIQSQVYTTIASASSSSSTIASTTSTMRTDTSTVVGPTSTMRTNTSTVVGPTSTMRTNTSTVVGSTSTMRTNTPTTAASTSTVSAATATASGVPIVIAGGSETPAAATTSVSPTQGSSINNTSNTSRDDATSHATNHTPIFTDNTRTQQSSSTKGSIPKKSCNIQ